MADDVMTTPPPRQVEHDPPTAVIDTYTVHRMIAVTVAFVLIGGLWVFVADQVLGLDDTLLGRMSARLFNLDWERGIPAVFSFLLLLGTALCVWTMTFTSVDPVAVGRYRARWRLLALALLFVAFDELLVVHESVSEQLREAFGFSGLLQHAWTIPYTVAALVLAALMVAPLRALPRWPRLLLLAGGLCYGGGAVGMETVAAAIKTAGLPAWVYFVEVFVEETMEMLGVWIFLAGVLTILRGASLRLVAR